MAFLYPSLSSRDICFSVADDHMGNDHFLIQISLDKLLKRKTPFTEPRYRFDKTDDDLLHNTLKDSLSSIDYTRRTRGTCCHPVKAVDTSTPKTYSCNYPKTPISQAILDLIKENVGLGGRTITHNILTPNSP